MDDLIPTKFILLHLVLLPLVQGSQRYTQQVVLQILMDIRRMGLLRLVNGSYFLCKHRWFLLSNTQPVNSLGIYYQNVRCLKTKQLELYDNVWSTNHNIICLTETWLNDMPYDHNLFPDGYSFPF
jgi:hypothetical protein